MENLTTWISEHAVDWAIQIGIAIAIFVIGKFIARIVANLLRKVMQQAGSDAMLVGFVGNVAYGILLVAVVLAAASKRRSTGSGATRGMA